MCHADGFPLPPGETSAEPKKDRVKKERPSEGSCLPPPPPETLPVQLSLIVLLQRKAKRNNEAIFLLGEALGYNTHSRGCGRFLKTTSGQATLPFAYGEFEAMIWTSGMLLGQYKTKSDHQSWGVCLCEGSF